MRSSLRTLVLIWAAWALTIIGFQTLVQNRFQPDRPDYATEWTPNETGRRAQAGKIYLLEPFMNNQVSWDSEFYLSIATVGYDDPAIRIVETPDGDFSMNYAFFPLYPLVVRVVRAPLTLLGLTPIGASALGGVIVSLLGTLAGMIALYDIARARLGEAGGIRAAVSLLIFPSAFFLAQVYTEGLFVGLCFGALALMRRRHLLAAALLAALATWTRSVGVFLIIPLALAWLGILRDREWSLSRLDTRFVLQGLAVILLPVAAYLIWQAAVGTPFNAVQTSWFGRQFFNMDQLGWGLERAIHTFVSGENPQGRVYFGLEFAAVIFAVIACVVTARRYPLIALFSLIAIVLSATSGAPQSLIRYMLVVPSVHLMIAQFGKSEAFDRSWTILSVLLLGILTALFTWDMWVA